MSTLSAPLQLCQTHDCPEGCRTEQSRVSSGAVNEESSSSLSKWVVRLALVALAIGAVAGLRQVAVKKSEQDFEEKLRRLDANRR
jgi:hypothetical protein